MQISTLKDAAPARASCPVYHTNHRAAGGCPCHFFSQENIYCLTAVQALICYLSLLKKKKINKDRFLCQTPPPAIKVIAVDNVTRTSRVSVSRYPARRKTKKKKKN